MAAHVTICRGICYSRRSMRRFTGSLKALCLRVRRTDFRGKKAILRHQGLSFVERFDANSLSITRTRAASAISISPKVLDNAYGCLCRNESALLRRLFFRATVWLYSSVESRNAHARAQCRNRRMSASRKSRVTKGHDSFLLETTRNSTIPCAGFLDGSAALYGQ